MTRIPAPADLTQKIADRAVQTAVTRASFSEVSEASVNDADRTGERRVELLEDDRERRGARSDRHVK